MINIRIKSEINKEEKKSRKNVLLISSSYHAMFSIHVHGVDVLEIGNAPGGAAGRTESPWVAESDRRGGMQVRDQVSVSGAAGQTWVAAMVVQVGSPPCR